MIWRGSTGQAGMRVTRVTDRQRRRQDEPRLRLERLLSREEADEELAEPYRRLLDVMRQDLEEVVFLSVQGLARRAGMSPSSVVRFAQRLGFKGYPDLREVLKESLLARISLPARLGPMVGGSRGTPASIKDVLEEERALLLEMAGNLDEQALNRVCDRILSARRVYLFGEGPAVCLVELLAFRLRRFRLSVLPVVQGGKSLFDHLIGLGPEDLLIAFGLGRPAEELEISLAHARRVGAGTVLVCDHRLPHFEHLADVRVCLVDRSIAQYRSMTLATAFIELLVVRMMARNPQATVAALESLEHLRRQHGYPRLPSGPVGPPRTAPAKGAPGKPAE